MVFLKKSVAFYFMALLATSVSFSTVSAEEKKSEPQPVNAPAAAADTAKASTEVSNEGESGGYGKTSGLLGPVTIGPMLTLLSLPQPFGVALEGKYKDLFGFGVKYGFLPTLDLLGASLRFNAIDARVRWFAFRGSFFLGAGIGQQTLGATLPFSTTVSSTTVTGETAFDVKTLYVNPQIGWRWVWESGFMMGMELGYQAALNATTTFSFTSSDATLNSAVETSTGFTDAKTAVEDAGDTLGKMGLPIVTLLQVGFLF